MVILSVSGDSIRRFMLAALDLGYINGEYVFMDVEMFPFHGENRLFMLMLYVRRPMCVCVYAYTKSKHLRNATFYF